MKNRIKIECLINPTEEQCIEREPLLAFSFFLSERNNNVLILSDEIIENLELGFNDGKQIDTTRIANASISTWFWILGAYEIVRTISQAKDCFTDEFIAKINVLKEQLAIVRMPSAKMEEKGKKLPVTSNRCLDAWDLNLKDLIVGSPENPKSARQLINLYDTTFSSLLPSDIKKQHSESYNKI